MAEKEEKKTDNKIEIIQVATQTEPGYKLSDGNVLSLPEYLVWLGNEVQTIKKSVL